PFVLDKWTAGQLVVLDKNASDVGTKPYLNEVDAQIGVTPEVAILRMQSGQMDLPQPDINIPSAQYVQLSADPKWKNRIVSTPNVDIWYLAMNPNMKPFDKVEVRKAFNYAINKGSQAKILAGRAVINNGIQAPPMPGYVPNYNPLGLDANGQNVQKAKDLLAQAGYGPGKPFPPQTLVYTKSNADADREAAAVQQDLAAGQHVPWVAMYSTVEANISSTRVHGYHLHPVWPLIVTSIWVTGAAASASAS